MLQRCNLFTHEKIDMSVKVKTKTIIDVCSIP